MKLLMGARLPTVVTGLDRIASGEKEVVNQLRGRRIGLLAHPASVDRQLNHAWEVLEGASCPPKVLFGPEHGYGGHVQDMVRVDSEVEIESAIQIYSIYGDTEADLRPRIEWLKELDAVVIDLQDVGSRYYTFIWTAALMLQTAASCGVQTIVLDRPNPLGGTVVEGSPQRPGYRSFVGLYDVSVRHGMTIAEILTMVQRIQSLDRECLKVIKMKNWSRDLLFGDTGLPWVMPSPNMPSISTTEVYSGACLLEGTNISEGRGTTRPFEIWGAPFLDSNRLVRSLAVDGAILRPLHFIPTFHKHMGQVCSGIQVHVIDAASFCAYEFYLRAIASVREQSGDAMTFRSDEYEFVTDRPAIDLLTGGPEFRLAVTKGSSLRSVLEAEREGAKVFRKSREKDLLY